MNREKEKIVKFFDSRRLARLEHVKRMPSKILDGKVHGEIKRGRPRKIWI